MSRIFLLKTGSSFPGTVRQWGDFESWTIKGLDLSADEVQVLDLPNGDPLPEVEACRGVVVTGSHAMVTDRLPWSMALEAWVPALIEAGIPFLGICYGHQLLAQAQGGTVGFHPGGKEIGTVDIHLLPVSSTDPLFCGLPSPFSAHTTHSQSVLSLPPDAIRLASNSFEPNHAFRIGPCAWGIQFHPEYDTKIMESYVVEQAKELEESRRDIQEVLRTIRDTPVAAAILRRFAFLLRVKEAFNG